MRLVLKRTRLLAVSCLLLTSHAWAESLPSGDSVRAWLALQQRQPSPSSVVAPQPAEVADRVYQRYLDSFMGNQGAAANRVPDGISPQAGQARAGANAPTP